MLILIGRIAALLQVNIHFTVNSRLDVLVRLLLTGVCSDWMQLTGFSAVQLGLFVGFLLLSFVL